MTDLTNNEMESTEHENVPVNDEMEVEMPPQRVHS